MTPLEILNAVSSIATAVGVAVAASQLLASRKQAVTTFEDTLSNQYRMLVERFPVEALFGEPLNQEDQVGLLPHFYRYFDLCNEQAFLQNHGRISAGTWKNWKEGIVGNMSRPAFAAAWEIVARRAGKDFSELRALCPPSLKANGAQPDA